jgi:hypothetical protein
MGGRHQDGGNKCRLTTRPSGPGRRDRGASLSREQADDHKGRMRPRNNVRAYCSAVMTPSLVPTGVSALRNRKIAGGRFGSLAAAELHCRRRQLLPRDRPPWRVTMASAPGHKPPSALQKKAEEATVDHPIVPRKFTGCYGTRVVV